MNVGFGDVRDGQALVSRCGKVWCDVAVRIDDDRLAHLRRPNQIARLSELCVVEPLHNHLIVPDLNRPVNQPYSKHKTLLTFWPPARRPLDRVRLSGITTAQLGDQDSMLPLRRAAGK